MAETLLARTFPVHAPALVGTRPRITAGAVIVFAAQTASKTASCNTKITLYNNHPPYNLAVAIIPQITKYVNKKECRYLHSRKLSADTRTRTGDLILTKDVLYHLSHISMVDVLNSRIILYTKITLLSIANEKNYVN